MTAPESAAALADRLEQRPWIHGRILIHDSDEWRAIVAHLRRLAAAEADADRLAPPARAFVRALERRQTSTRGLTRVDNSLLLKAQMTLRLHDEAVALRESS